MSIREGKVQDPDWLKHALGDIREAAAWRCDRAVYRDGEKIRRTDSGRVLINFSSNDYLGLSHDSRLVEAVSACVREYGVGSGAARLVTGTTEMHQRLEEKVCQWLGREAALLFGSGYLCNIGVVSCIARRHDAVIADRAVHASLADGILLSRAEMHRFQHNDLDDLERLLKKTHSERTGDQRILVVTESVFSMDGDVAELAKIVSLAAQYDALLLVDESHALGVFGEKGAGVTQASGKSPETAFVIGTLSKALGSYGGFVTCSPLFRDYFVNKARPFIFSTSLPPAVIVAGLAALEVVCSEPDLGAKLLAKATKFRNRLVSAGLDVRGSASQIVPVIVGENEAALSFSAKLEAKGILGICIRPPTVPAGLSRIRFSVTLSHTEEQLLWAADEISRTAKECEVI